MVPAAFVFLDVAAADAERQDRPPGPGAARAGSLRRGGEARALRTPVEEIVAGLWSEVLGLGRVGPDDNFFQLGGHSLSGAQVVSRLRQELQVDLPLRALFEAPTVAALAAEIERRRLRRTGLAERPAISSFHQDRSSPPPLSFAQERFWAGRQLEARTVAPGDDSDPGAARRAARPRLPAAGAAGDRRPPRGAEDELRGRRGGAGPGRPSASPRSRSPSSTWSRSLPADRSWRRSGAGAPRPAAAFRLRAGAAVPADPLPVLGAGQRAALHRPPHRLRRLVALGADGRAVGPLQRLPRGPALPPAPARRPVPGLRALAAADGRGGGPGADR